MKEYRITLGDHTFDVKVLDDPRQKEVRVEVDGEPFTVNVEAVASATATEAAAEIPPQETDSAAARAAVKSAPPSTGAITAPLPGVVKSISVQSGQRVTEGETLLTIEAMKMDNIIRAPRAGTIDTINVTEGRQVAYGDSLLTFRN